MEFSLGGTDVRARDATWIQATGQIDKSTVSDFITFVEGPQGWPRRIRFDSPGGSLIEGLRLGRELRQRGFATEIGNHMVDPIMAGFGSWEFTKRVPGHCASACAYAFMGGVERTIGDEARLGLHRFFVRNDDGTLMRLPAGEEQRVSALLLEYMTEMGVSSQALVSASRQGPEEMYWVSSGIEATRLSLHFLPNEWLPWTIEMAGRGIIARSERRDGLYQMEVACTAARGAYYDIYIRDEEDPQSDWSLRDWVYDQCLPQGSFTAGDGWHLILGNRVSFRDMRLIDRSGGFTLRANLGRDPEIGGDPSFLHDDYISACTTERFSGTTEKARDAIRLALSNCID